MFGGGLTFYILNVDFPQEWFIGLRRKLLPLGATIRDVKISSERIVDLPLNSIHSYINYVASLILFIPEVIGEDRILYMDGDVIVTGDLTPLFEMEMGDYPIAAVNDLDIQTDMWNLGIHDTFNSGVVLFNNCLLRQQNQSSILLDTAKKHYEEIRLGDQSVLNIAFRDKWIHLDRTYNHLLAADSNWDIGDRRGHKVGKIVDLPLVLHYCAPEKPWQINCWMQLKDLWWHYNSLEWEDIIVGQTEFHKYTNRPSLLVVTGTGDLERLEDLLQLLPDYDIHICAYTNFWSGVSNLISYENMKLHPHVLNITLDNLLNECQGYLDIHYGDEVYDSIQKMQAMGKPIFGFVNTSHDTLGTSHLYSLEQVTDMANDIREILG